MNQIHLLFGAFLISFSGVFVALADVSPTASAFYRTFIGSGALLAYLLITKERLWHSPRHAALSALAGLLFALDLSFWHRSILLVGPGLATILSNCQVFFMAVVGVFFMGERAGPGLWAGIALALAGLYFLVGLDLGDLEPGFAWGVALGILTAITYVAYLLVLRKAQSGPDAPRSEAAVASASLAAAFFLALELPLAGEGFAVPNAESWMWLIAYGLVAQFLGWAAITRGLPRVAASRAGLILLLQPTLAFIWDILIFSRPTEPEHIAGAVMAVGGIYLGAMRKARPGSAV